MHLAEYAGSGNQHGGDAEKRRDGSRTRIAGSFQDGFDELAAGRTQHLAELFTDRAAGGVMSKDETSDRNHDQKHWRQ